MLKKFWRKYIMGKMSEEYIKQMEEEILKSPEDRMEYEEWLKDTKERLQYGEDENFFKM